MLESTHQTSLKNGNQITLPATESAPKLAGEIIEIGAQAEQAVRLETGELRLLSDISEEAIEALAAPDYSANYRVGASSVFGEEITLPNGDRALRYETGELYLADDKDCPNMPGTRLAYWLEKVGALGLTAKKYDYEAEKDLDKLGLDPERRSVPKESKLDLFLFECSRGPTKVQWKIGLRNGNQIKGYAAVAVNTGIVKWSLQIRKLHTQ